MRPKLLYWTLLLVVIFGSALPAFVATAATTGTDTSTTKTTGIDTTTGSGKLINPLGEGATPPGLLKAILEFVVRIGAVVVVLMLVYVGFLFVTAQGNETKITAAKSGLLWTVVGALILLGAQAIALAIEATVKALSTST